MENSSQSPPGSGRYFGEWPNELLMLFFEVVDDDTLKSLRRANHFFANLLAPRVFRNVLFNMDHELDWPAGQPHGDLLDFAWRAGALYARTLNLRIGLFAVTPLGIGDVVQDMPRWIQMGKMLGRLEEIEVSVTASGDWNRCNDHGKEFDNVLQQLNAFLITANGVRIMRLQMSPIFTCCEPSQLVPGRWSSLEELRLESLNIVLDDLPDFLRSESRTLRKLELLWLFRDHEDIHWHVVFRTLAEELELTYFHFASYSGNDRTRGGSRRGEPRDRAITEIQNPLGRITKATFEEIHWDETREIDVSSYHVYWRS